jgi:pyruvate/2-oxoglutarate dehydrogenase complex dihydrolipoamide acyltransferase (E2) component
MNPTIPISWEGDGPAIVTQWFFEDGDSVVKGDVVCELMQEKATIAVDAPSDGRLAITASVDTEINPGMTIGSIST